MHGLVGTESGMISWGMRKRASNWTTAGGVALVLSSAAKWYTLPADLTAMFSTMVAIFQSPWMMAVGVGAILWGIREDILVRRERRHQEDEQLAKDTLILSPYETSKKKVRDIGIQYYRSLYPWWMRVWMRLRK